MKSYTPEKTLELLQLGNISSLEDNLYPTGYHTFDRPQRGVTVVYERDRGESFQGSVSVNRKVDLLESCPYVDIDYYYLLNEYDQWMVKYRDWNSWIPISIAIMITENV